MIEAALKRDRLILIMVLVVMTLIAVLYTALGVDLDTSALGMTTMAMQPASWTPVYFGLVFLMWWVMMMAMMLPSASPMILLYAAVKRKSVARGELALLTALFLAGYLLVWGGFSLIAAGLQWALELRGLVSPAMMTLTSDALGGTILLAAGLYQLTPIKQACLHHCRSPVHSLSQHHRPGRVGALRMGLGHGAYCLGCCWFLMALLFFGGIMNLYWIFGLALFVLGEKLLPRGDLFGRGVGAGLALWGVLLLGSAAGYL